MRKVLAGLIFVGSMVNAGEMPAKGVPTVFTFDGDGSTEMLALSRDVLNLTVTARTPQNEPTAISQAPDGLGVVYGPGGHRSAAGESLILDFGETKVRLDEVIVSVVRDMRIRMLIDAGATEVVLRVGGPEQPGIGFRVFDLSEFDLKASRFQFVPVVGTGPAGHGIRLSGVTVTPTDHRTILEDE